MQRFFATLTVVLNACMTDSLIAMARQCEIAIQLYGVQNEGGQRLSANAKVSQTKYPDFYASRVEGLRTIQARLIGSNMHSVVWQFNSQTLQWRDISRLSPQQEIATIDFNSVSRSIKSEGVLEFYSTRSSTRLQQLYSETIFENTGDDFRGLLPLHEDFSDAWQLMNTLPPSARFAYGTVAGENVTFLIGPKDTYEGEAKTNEFTDFSSTRMYGIFALDGIDRDLALMTHIRTLLHINSIIFDNDARLSVTFAAKVLKSNNLSMYAELGTDFLTVAKPQ